MAKTGFARHLKWRP